MNLYSLGLLGLLLFAGAATIVQAVTLLHVLRAGEAVHYVITLRSGVSQAYDEKRKVTRAAEPSLYWKAVLRHVVGLLAFTAFIAVMVRDKALDPQFLAWARSLF